METHDSIVTFCASVLHQAASFYLPQGVLKADRILYHHTHSDQTAEEIFGTLLIYAPTMFAVWTILHHIVIYEAVRLCLKVKNCLRKTAQK